MLSWHNNDSQFYNHSRSRPASNLLQAEGGGKVGIALHPGVVWRNSFMPMSADYQIDYIEFQAADLAATRKFFEQLFRWKFTDYGPDYTSFTDGRISGGFSRAEKRSTLESGGVLVVFYYPRLEEVRQRVIDLGGRITVDI